MSPSPTVAYIASGQLFCLKPGTSQPEVIESDFAAKIRERQHREQERSGWRGSSPIWSSMRMQPELNAMGRLPQIADQHRAWFGYVAPGGDDQAMLYILHTSQTSGLFEYTPGDGYERRLVHRQGLNMRDLRRHPGDGRIIFTMEMDDGTSHLGLSEDEGRRPKQVTEGDCRDECPAWVGPDQPNTIVYQSSGVGRDAMGHFLGLGPYHVEQLDLDSGEHRRLLESEDYDYLLPRIGADGAIYAIRRPYDPRGVNTYGWADTLKDAVLLPFRIAMAFFYFFNAFSMIFTGKPLTSADGWERAQQRQPYMMLWGRLIKTKHAWRTKSRKAHQPLVPRDWELVRVRDQGDEQVVAGHVLSYDLCEQGIVFTDGRKIMLVDHQGDEQVLGKAHMIEHVAVLRS